MAWGKQAMSLLGLDQYSSLHLRRNEIQFIESRAEPEITASVIDRLLDKDEVLYIATDESDPRFFSLIEDQRRVYRYTELADKLKSLDQPVIIPDKYIGCVEQVICCGGRRFIGTPHSSYSTYIGRIRGYRDAPDKTLHSHTKNEFKRYRDPGFLRRSVAGTGYMQEDPALWEDLEIDMPIYSVSCTDTREYAHWQCELLEYSWKQVAQPGQLLRLVSHQENDALPAHGFTEIFPTSFNNFHPETGDDYVPYNRLYSFREWLQSEPGARHRTHSGSRLRLQGPRNHHGDARKTHRSALARVCHG